MSDSKNLLGFSGGVDSTALFWLLLDREIEFDIAIVDYKKREDSYKEVEFAKKIAKRFDKLCFAKEAIVGDSNFEHNARAIRYEFFRDIISKSGYQNLILAHQLNDRFEWFMMQFTKGCGVAESIGFKEIERVDNYNIVRPLFEISRDEIERFLGDKEHYIDSSNKNLKYKRNYFRSSFCSKLVSEYSSGIRSSFRYFEKDIEELEFIKVEDLYIIKRDFKRGEIRAVDRALKRLGVLISSKSREEIERCDSCVISHKISVEKMEKFIFISPYIKCKMPKEFKEKCRIYKLPSKIRGYIFENSIDIEYLAFKMTNF